MINNPYSREEREDSGEDSGLGSTRFTEPLKFLGGLVTGFNCTVGWGGTASSLSVELVEEDEWESPIVFPEMGTPHHFEAGDFTFNGLLRSVTRNESPGGGITYSLSLESPNLILDGGQVILDKYSADIGFRLLGASNYSYHAYDDDAGAFGVTVNSDGESINAKLKEDKYLVNLIPNVFNVYKFYESVGRTVYSPNHPNSNGAGFIQTGFGVSHKNEMGVRWLDIIWALESMCGVDQRNPGGGKKQTNGTATWSRDWRDVAVDQFGNPGGQGTLDDADIDYYTTIGAGLHLGANTYQVDFSELAKLDSLTYDDDTKAFGVIPWAYRIGAANISIVGIIQDLTETAQADFFIELLDDLKTIKVRVVRRDFQPELGKVEEYVSQQKSLGNAASLSVGEAYADNIMGKMVIGDNQTRMLHTASSSWTVPYGFFTSSGLTSEAQRQPLTSNGSVGYGGANYNKFTVVVDRPGGGRFPYTADELEIRFAAHGMQSWRGFLAISGKGASQFSISDIGPGGFTIDQVGTAGIKNWLVQANDGKNQQKQTNNKKDGGRGAELLQAVCSALKKTYDEWGTQMLVRVPSFASFYSDPDAGGVGEWVNEWDLQNAAYDFNSGIFSQPIDAGFYNDTGLKQALVVFPYNPQFYNYSQLQADSYAVEGSRIYVKAQVDPKYVWHNSGAGFEPHALVKFPKVTYGRIGYNTNHHWQDFDGIMALLRKINPTVWNSLKAAFYGPGGSSSSSFPLAPSPKSPSYIYVPQKSSRFVYGPWIHIGGIGKANFVQESSLKPESFGSEQNMNDFGRVIAAAGISTMNTDEHGDVEVVGFPALNLGDRLQGGAGPYLTDINVTVSPDKITSRYSFKTWKVDFGKIAKWQTDQFKRGVSIAIKLAKDVRNLISKPAAVGQNTSVFDMQKIMAAQDERLKPNKSPNWFIGGANFKAENYNNIITPQVAGLTDKDMGWVAEDENWNVSALMSMDGIFRPYSSTGSSSEDYSIPNMPSFKKTDRVAGQDRVTGHKGENSYHLDPLNVKGSQRNGANEHDIISAAFGTAFPEHGPTYLRNKVKGADSFMEPYRAIGLRGPLVLVGWGFDFTGLPVPNNGNSGGDDLGSRNEQFINNHMTSSDKWKAGPVGDITWDYKRGTWIPRPQLVVCEVLSQSSSNAIAGAFGTPPGGGGNNPSENQSARLKRKDRPEGVGDIIENATITGGTFENGSLVLAYWWAYDQQWYVVAGAGGTGGVETEVVCDVECGEDGTLTVKTKTIRVMSADDDCGASTGSGGDGDGDGDDDGDGDGEGGGGSGSGSPVICSVDGGGTCIHCYNSNTGRVVCSGQVGDARKNCNGVQHSEGVCPTVS